MLETLQGLFGLALIAGLFVYYFRERRAKNRPPTPEPAIVEPAPVADDSEPVLHGPSPNWGAPIMYVLLLHFATITHGSWWSMLWLTIYFAIFGVAWYSTFSEKELANEQARRPGTTRREHYLKLGVPYLLFPFLGWLGAIVFGLRLAVLIPALPWVGLLAFGALAMLREAVFKPSGQGRR